MSTTGRDPSDQRVFFVLWAFVGAGACLAVLAVMTIGVLVAPVVALSAWILVRSAGADRSMTGAVSGVSLMLFYVAVLNREGPGEVCRVRTNFTECAEQRDPWPWFVVGLVFLSVGIGVFYLLGRLRPSA